MHHIIIGAGPAGVIAAEAIRKHRAQDQITIIGDEKEAPYSRMAIPYLLAGNISEEGTHLRKTATHFVQQNIQLVQARVTHVDVKARSLQLDNGQNMTYDKLLIATGSTPNRAPIPGIDLPGIFNCWTLADARHIMAHVKPGSTVLQMGAGFIGCIIMEALAARVEVSKGQGQLHVVEMGDRMVPRMLGSTAGGMIKDWCQAKGVRVHTSAKVETITQNAGKLEAKLSTSQTIPADVIISATGVKPTIGFLQGSGIACSLGVLTDEFMQTNVPDVYAAGDCAQALDKMTGKQIVSAIQPNAADQAYVAALNMAGHRATLKGVTQINVLDTLGMISASFGQWEGVPDSEGGDHVVLTDRASGKHLSLQFKGDVMVGCNSIGYTEHVGVMRGLVEGRVKLGTWKDKLKNDPTQLIAAYIAASLGQNQWSGASDARRR